MSRCDEDKNAKMNGLEGACDPNSDCSSRSRTEQDHSSSKDQMQEGVKKRVLSMKGKDDKKDVRMNPHYKESISLSAFQGDEVDRSNTVLKQAIHKKDLSYISEFLLSKSRNVMLRKLSNGDKEALGELLLDFVDQPLRAEALETIRDIVSNIKNVESFIDRLKGRSIDFSKLIYIKGKLDYLRFTMNIQTHDEPEAVIDG